jgi:hypothetical protein
MPVCMSALGGHIASQLSPAANTAPLKGPSALLLPPSSGWRSKPSASRNEASLGASGETVQKRNPRTFIHLDTPLLSGEVKRRPGGRSSQLRIGKSLENCWLRRRGSTGMG